MNRMIEESKNWFESVNSNIDMYSVISTNKDSDNRNSIESFETSNNDHLKLLFCVNMLNEGLHVNDIDGVIMLRPTISPIIYLQQLGRELSVGHNEHPLIFDIVNNSLGIKDIDKFSEEQKQILSYLGFIPETEVVDINNITQYILTRLNQATEKDNAEMINNYQNILGLINQKNNGLNGA